jgi:hypothetical protein
VTLRQVAQYADMSNFGAHAYTGSARSLGDVRRKLGVLRAHCAAMGRPPESLLCSHITYPLILAETPGAVQAKVSALPAATRELVRSSLVACTPDEAIAYDRALVAAGLQYFIPTTVGLDAETLDLLAHRVVPAVVAPSPIRRKKPR